MVWKGGRRLSVSTRCTSYVSVISYQLVRALSSIIVVLCNMADNTLTRSILSAVNFATWCSRNQSMWMCVRLDVLIKK